MYIILCNTIFDVDFLQILRRKKPAAIIEFKIERKHSLWPLSIYFVVDSYDEYGKIYS